MRFTRVKKLRKIDLDSRWIAKRISACNTHSFQSARVVNRGSMAGARFKSRRAALAIIYEKRKWILR